MAAERFEGQNGVIEIYDDRIEIRREGWMSRLAYDEVGKRFLKEDVTGIKTESHKLIRPAHISIQEKGRETPSPNIFSAPEDENTVGFSDSEEWENAVEALEAWMDDTSNRSDETEEVAKAELRRKYAKGEITEETYRDRLSVLEETE